MTSTNQNISIDLIAELKKQSNYNKLFPSEEIGIAVIMLFKQFGSKTFSEKDIQDALSITNTTSNRNEWEQYGRAITLLQEFFIIYDSESQLYSLKPYAIEYCGLAEKQLRGRVDSTRIETICKALLSLLKDSMDEKSLNEWFDIHFNAFQNELSDQVHFLDGQIKDSVDYLRSSSLMETEDPIGVLKEVNDGLTKVREQNKELRAAYRQLDSIREKLDQVASAINSNNLHSKIGKINVFFSEIRFVLRAIDQKLDRIQPKVRQLFANLNQPLLNSRVEQFLRLVLKQSDIKHKQIHLPHGVNEPRIRIKPSVFTIVERKENWFPTKRKRMILPKINEATIKRVKEQNFKIIANQNKIDQHVNLLRNKLQVDGNLDVTKEFFSLYNDSDINLSTNTMVFYNLLQESNRHPNRELEIDSELVKHPEGNPISICKLKIHQK